MPESTTSVALNIIEILERVLDHCDSPEDLLKCAQVNKLWLKVSTDKLWCGSVLARRWRTPPTSWLFTKYHDMPKQLASYQEKIRFLYLDFRGIGELAMREGIEDFDLDRVSAIKPISLSIHQMPRQTQGLRLVEAMFHSQLHALHFEGCDNYPLLNHCLSLVQHNCPNLKSLIFSHPYIMGLNTQNSSFIQLLEALPSITHLSVCEYMLPNAAFWEHLASRKNLRWLETDLHARNSSRSVFLSLLGDVQNGSRPPILQELRGLKLGWAPHRTLFWDDFLAHCKELELLELHIEDEVACHIPSTICESISSPEKLRYLKLTVHNTLLFSTAESLVPFFKSCPRLEFFYIERPGSAIKIGNDATPTTFKFDLTGKTALAVAQSLPAIRYFHFHLPCVFSAVDIFAFAGHNCPMLNILSVNTEVELYELVDQLPNAPSESRPQQLPVPASSQFPILPKLKKLAMAKFAKAFVWQKTGPSQGPSKETSGAIKWPERNGRSFTAVDWASETYERLKRYMPMLSQLEHSPSKWEDESPMKVHFEVALVKVISSRLAVDRSSTTKHPTLANIAATSAAAMAVTNTGSLSPSQSQSQSQSSSYPAGISSAAAAAAIAAVSGRRTDSAIAGSSVRSIPSRAPAAGPPVSSSPPANLPSLSSRPLFQQQPPAQRISLSIGTLSAGEPSLLHEMYFASVFGDKSR